MSAADTGDFEALPWATDQANVCGSPLLVMDDHWGAIQQSCDLISGHQGDHGALLRGCIPNALLSWPDKPEEVPRA